jgi:hypothetical protein
MVLVKGWRSSNIWGKPSIESILFRKKLRADLSQGMLNNIRCRMFCLPVLYPKICRLTL